MKSEEPRLPASLLANGGSWEARHRSQDPRGEGESVGSDRIKAFEVRCIVWLGLGWIAQKLPGDPSRCNVHNEIRGNSIQNAGRSDKGFSRLH
jgi:hypothetical protein